MKAALYVRVSTEDQAKKYSIPAQKKELTALAHRYGFEIVKIYDEGGISGESLIGRPKILEMLKDASAGKFGALFIVALDRLSRNLKDALYIREKLREAGITIYTPSQAYDLNDIDGDLTLNIFGSIADYERKRILERCRKGRMEKRNKGEWLGGIPPLGYKYDPVKKGLVVDPDEAEKVRTILNTSLHYSPYFASQKLRSLGIIVSPRQIRRMMENRKLLFYSGRTTDSDGNIIKAVWDPIISEEFANKILAAKKARRCMPKGKAKFLLTGLGIFRCRFCGRTVKSWYGGGQYRYYRCSSIQYGEQCPNNRMWRTYIIDQVVWKTVIDVINDVDNIEEGYKLLNNDEEYLRKKAMLEGELQRVGNKLRRIITAIGEGIIDFAEAREEVSKLREQRADLEIKLKNLNIQNSSMLSLEDFRRIFGSNKIYDEMGFEDKKEIIATLVSKIMLSKKAVYVNFKVPFVTGKEKKVSTEVRVEIRKFFINN